MNTWLCEHVAVRHATPGVVASRRAQAYITFEICANDTTDDEDVEVPYVRYKFRNF